MTDRISHHFETRKSILVLLVTILIAGSCWAQIPWEKAGCFTINGITFKACGTSWVDYLGSTKYNCHCNCPSTAGPDCVPAGSGNTNTSTGSTIFDVVPSQLLPDGLAQGKAFFSPHPSEETINWMIDYWVKLISMGMPFDKNNTLSADDIPLTGDINFDKLYLNEMIRFEKPEQGGVVDLSGIGSNKGTKTEPAISDKPLPIMGSAPMTQDERERQNLLHLKSMPDNRLDASNFKYEEAPFWDTPEMKSLGTDALKFTAGFISGPVSYPVVIGVDIFSGIVNNKSKQEIIIDVLGDVSSKAVGDVVGFAIGKVKTNTGSLNTSTVKVSAEALKDEYEFMLQGGQTAIDTWTGIKSSQKKKTK